MWTDNETNRDFLNFRIVAATAAEMIAQAKGQPLSLGVSGGWGVGKSSMVRLIREELESRTDAPFLMVDFNAWLYQGYDDARAALMETIARNLLTYAEEKKSSTDKVVALLKRVDWLRASGLAASAMASLTLGIPPIGIVGGIAKAAKGLGDGDVSEEDVAAATTAGTNVVDAGKRLIKPRPDTTPPKEINALREHFSETLKELGVTLVVFIDDLDRCLPQTAIATLEAIRLFLFLDNTAFVIAADDKMIRQAVRVHFKEVQLDDDLVTSYFDKLIQVPLRVPPLGTQDVRAYLMLLFIENSGLAQSQRDDLREKVCKQLGETWQGKRVDRGFVASLIPQCPTSLSAQLDLADRLAYLMTTANNIAGNPRLIKRFLNTLWIRLSIARAQKVPVDEAALAKMLLFERCGDAKAYGQLIKAINESPEGKPAFISSWEKQLVAGAEVDLPPEWNSDFAREWLTLQPAFADQDLRAAAYVSREHMPFITSMDQLSPEGLALLVALSEMKTATPTLLQDKLRALPKREVGIILSKLLDKARLVETWGVPPVLHACMAVANADPEQATVLGEFLRATVLPSRLDPSLIPILTDKTWAKPALESWASHKDTAPSVKKAITKEKKGGN